jgi:EAL domain-containing protein (putative c-di-GMP-specific phosphodiesterase class I)
LTELKVDKSFVATMVTNAQDAVIVRTLIELGRSLGLRTVAEGVESVEAFDLLREFGCDEAQGYLLSRPVPAAQFRAWLDRQQVRALDRGEGVLPFRERRATASGDDVAGG